MKKAKILYVATKQPNYSRIKLLRAALEKNYEVHCLFSDADSYPVRIFEVSWRFIKIKKRGYDIVLVGFFAQLIFPLVRIFWSGKIVADCFISLYDSLICDRSKYKAGSLAARFAAWMDAYMLRHSDVTLTDTQAHADYLVEEYSIDRTKIVSIPVSADENVFPYTPAKAEDYVYGTEFEVLFYGAYIPLQGTDVIVRAAKLLEDLPIRIRMVGDGQTFEATQKIAHDLNLKNVTFHGLQTLARLAEMSCQSHLLLGIFGTTEKARRVIPNKVFEAVCLGRPVITGDSETVREYFSDGKSILTVPFGDPEALANKIRWVQANYAEAVVIGQCGRTVFESALTPEHVRQRMSAVVDSLA